MLVFEWESSKENSCIILKLASHFFSTGNESGVCTSVVGTVVYWCPEITQQKPYDCKADIWAYGCILYQTCTLKPPFEAENILLLAKKIVERKFVAIDSNLSYSKLMRDIIYSCITVEAQDRPDSIGSSDEHSVCFSW